MGIKILLAVDGSERSYEAARAIGVLAAGSELVVLNVVDVPGLAYPTLGAGLAKDLAMQVELAMRKEAEQVLDRVTSFLPSDLASVQKRIELGSPAEMILTVAKECQVDLIVLGSRGLGPIREHVFGSVSHRVMTHAPSSTLIVKGPLQEVRQILLPVESEEDGEAAVAFLSKKPFRMLPKVMVLHVVPFTQPVLPVGALIPEKFRKEMIAYAEEFTGNIAARLTQLGYEAEGVAVMGAPALAIAEEAEAHCPELILMRTHSRSGLSRFLLGSVSHSVAHHTACSFLLIK
ncbi:MAG: universal stress protein [Nitrospirae bacterium]|nr:MAG: universal stress protein [Nitrospirota bacterium]